MLLSIVIALWALVAVLPLCTFAVCSTLRDSAERAAADADDIYDVVRPVETEESRLISGALAELAQRYEARAEYL